MTMVKTNDIDNLSKIVHAASRKLQKAQPDNERAREFLTEAQAIVASAQELNFVFTNVNTLTERLLAEHSERFTKTAESLAGPLFSKENDWKRISNAMIEYLVEHAGPLMKSAREPDEKVQQHLQTIVEMNRAKEQSDRAVQQEVLQRLESDYMAKVNHALSSTKSILQNFIIERATIKL